jgi:hypothetical protein
LRVAARDAHLIDVSKHLLGQTDDPMLEAFRLLNGTIRLSDLAKDCPDRDRLALRFELLKARI